ncbi:MAG: hypothetical protein H6747_16085 [Deltaproteobacteria bacterium]|nr:hypothetical protein [Deltaproteobacteria bacterium]
MLTIPFVMTSSATVRKMRDTDGGFVLATVYGPSRLDRGGVQVRIRTTPDIIGADPKEYSVESYISNKNSLLYRVTYLSDAAPAPSGGLVVLGHGHSDASAPEYGKKLVASDWFAVLDSSSKVVRKPVVLKVHAAEGLAMDLSSSDVLDREHHVQYVAQGGRVVRVDHDLYAALTPTAVWWSTGKRGPGGWGLTFSLFTAGGVVLLQRELGEFFGGETWNTPTLGVAWFKRLTMNELVAQLQPSGVLLRIRVTDGAVVGERHPGPFGAYSVFMPGPKVAYRRIVKHFGNWNQEFPEGNTGRKALFWQEILSSAPWSSQSTENETLVVRESPFVGFDKPYQRQCLAAASRSLPHDMIRRFDTKHVTVPAARFEATGSVDDCFEGIDNALSQIKRFVETEDAMHEVGTIDIGQIAFSGHGCSVSALGIFKRYGSVDGKRSRDASWRETIKNCTQCSETNTCCPRHWSAFPDEIARYDARSTANTVGFLGAICLTPLSEVGACAPGCLCELAIK